MSANWNLDQLWCLFLLSILLLSQSLILFLVLDNFLLRVKLYVGKTIEALGLFLWEEKRNRAGHCDVLKVKVMQPFQALWWLVYPVLPPGVSPGNLGSSCWQALQYSCLPARVPTSQPLSLNMRTSQASTCPWGGCKDTAPPEAPSSSRPWLLQSCLMSPWVSPAQCHHWQLYNCGQKTCLHASISLLELCFLKSLRCSLVSSKRLFSEQFLVWYQLLPQSEVEGSFN